MSYDPADQISVPENCDKCGAKLTTEELEEDYRFKKGPVCFKCLLKFLYKKRLLGEIVAGVLAVVTIVSFYVGNLVFGIFFIILMFIIYFDSRAVGNYIVDIESRLQSQTSPGENQAASQDSKPPEASPSKDNTIEATEDVLMNIESIDSDTTAAEVVQEEIIFEEDEDNQNK